MVIIDSQKYRIFADRTAANGFCTRHFLQYMRGRGGKSLSAQQPLPVPPTAPRERNGNSVTDASHCAA